MPTIRDVAEAAGVSSTAVSAVLNGKADQFRISARARARILEAAERLGFRGNPHARALRTGRTRLVGIMGNYLDQPLRMAGARAAARRLWSSGYNALIHDLAWHKQERQEFVEGLIGHQVDGVVVIGADSAGLWQILQPAAARGFPIVAFNCQGPPEVDAVYVDREAGAYLATRHLLSLGHRRIALTVDPVEAPPNAAARAQGYRRACREACIPAGEMLFVPPRRGVGDYARGVDVAEQALAHPARPTALFCTNDHIAVGALRALFARGLRVPEDMALVGFDGLEESEYAAVPLTTVHQPVEEVADTAVSLLLERMQCPTGQCTPRHVTVPPRLILRCSCGGSGAALAVDPAGKES